MNLGLVGPPWQRYGSNDSTRDDGALKSKAGATDKRLFLILDGSAKLKMGAEQTADFISTSGRRVVCRDLLAGREPDPQRKSASHPANCRDKYFLPWCGPRYGRMVALKRLAQGECPKRALAIALRPPREAGARV